MVNTSHHHSPPDVFVASPTADNQMEAFAFPKDGKLDENGDEKPENVSLLLTGLDCLFLGVESESFKMPIACLFFVDHTNQQQLKTQMERFARSVGPRMLYRVERDFQPWGRPHLVPVDFNIAHHFHIHAEEMDELELGSVLGGLYAQDFDWQKPLWEAHYFPLVKIANPDDSTRITSALFHKIHHAICDGQGYVANLVQFFGTTLETPKIFPRIVPSPPKTGWYRLTAMLQFLATFLTFIVHVIHVFFFSPWIRKGPWPGKLKKGRYLRQQLGWCQGKITVKAVQDLKRKFGTSFNDVLVSCVGGALNNWMKRYQGVDYIQNHMFVIPAGMRHLHDSSFSNHSSAFVLAVPASDDLYTRLKRTSIRMKSQKLTPEPWVYYAVMKSVKYPWIAPRWIPEVVFPFCAQRFVGGITSPPGPQSPICFASEEEQAKAQMQGLALPSIASDLIGFIPHYPGALGFGIASYNGRIRVGISMDVIPGEPGYAEGAAFDLAREIVSEFERLESLTKQM